jgi:hypothetical protein
MVANTVTGAASMFRTDLIPYLLPFPERVAEAYHDHWIALTALMRGRIDYIARPLYDYVQHTHNVAGHNYRPAPSILSLPGALMRRSSRRALRSSASVTYQLVSQKVFLAQTLLLRHRSAPSAKRSVLRRFRRFDRSGLAVAAEALVAAITRRPTLRNEQYMLRAVIAMRLASDRARQQQRKLLARYAREVARRTAPLPMPATPVASLKGNGSGRTKPALQHGSIAWISGGISGLKLNVSATFSRRINVILSTIDFRYVFGGYLAMFQFARQLRRRGHLVRIVLTEETHVDLTEWRHRIAEYEGLADLFDEVEVAYCYDRARPLDASPYDAFIATSCWGAHIAHQAMRDLGRERFAFVVQEYEPLFVPFGSIHALFQQAYDFPQFDLFSTDLLRDYFRDRQLGIYARGDGDPYSAVFQNAITRLALSRDALNRERRKLLFYARPEAHAARNMFELGVMVLVELIGDERFNAADWTFHGIGSIDQSVNLDLGRGIPLRLVPRVGFREYLHLLPGFDVGLSLMLSPHPSLVPLDMAAAGMLCVTNTYATKTAERLRAISSNLIAAEPSVTAIKDALVATMSKADDVDARLAGAKLNWAADWSETFAPQVMDRLDAFLAE